MEQGKQDQVGVVSQELRDWLLFLNSAHKMSEEDVQREIKTPAVLAAFERAKLSNLPKDVREQYDAEDRRYRKEKEEGRLEEK